MADLDVKDLPNVGDVFAGLQEIIDGLKIPDVITPLENANVLVKMFNGVFTEMGLPTLPQVPPLPLPPVNPALPALPALPSALQGFRMPKLPGF